MDNTNQLNLVISELNTDALGKLAVLYEQFSDIPVFYNIAFLESLLQSDQDPLLLAQLKDAGDNTLALLPGKTIHKGRFENVTFRGWDHLDVIAKNEAASQELISMLCGKFETVVLKSFRDTTKLKLSACFAFASEAYKCPYLELPSSNEIFLKELSSSFRKTVNRKTSKFVKDGGKIIIINNQSAPEDVRRSFDELWNLHDSRSIESNIDSRFTKSAAKNFHLALAKKASNYKGVSVIFFKAEIENKIIGVYYCFVTKNTVCYFNSGIDPEYHQYSAGVVLMAASIKWAIENSMQHFDFLRGTEAYKFHWTRSVSIDQHLYFAKSPMPRLRTFGEYFRDERKRFGGKQAIKRILKNSLTGS